MARPKSNVTTIPSSQEELGIVDTVENLEEKKETKKTISDTEMVKIKYIANKTIITLTGKITFDEKGIAEVSGKEAKRLLTIPGYALAK